jgi:polyisoprenoid-binding protein YceI
MIVSEVQGSFKTYEGLVTSASDDFNNAQINFSVDVNSVNTESADRDKHLKSDDFFNAEKFPKSKKIYWRQQLNQLKFNC